VLFNSLAFLVFLALFFAAWPFASRRPRRRLVYLTLTSFVFYGWWDWRYLFLLVGSSLFDFYAALAMERWPSRKKALLAGAMVANLAILGFFKYLDFGIQNLNGLMALFGFDTRIPLAHITLPVGISFFTFQAMSYAIDVYRGELRATRDPWHFFAYLALFPQLVAGPIVRAVDLMPQLLEERHPTERQRWDGLGLIANGFFKKVVVADHLAPVVNAAFGAQVPEGSPGYWWVILILFSFQIYCDFSGYSDIARGLAKWMGYEFMVNFDHPYIASGIREFWGRWHISLSTWFRDYIYIPLGGSRVPPLRAHFNIWLVMLVSGLWHGAAWTYLVWAALHALYMSVERITDWPDRLTHVPGGRHVAPVLVFLLVLVSWVFFRATSFEQAGHILGRLVDFRNLGMAIPGVRPAHYAIVGVMALRQLWFHFGLHRAVFTETRFFRFLQPAAIAAVFVACVYLRGPGGAFIYFQF
jgi:D-alanyl-lipoteichoic acid acyltransferase DltB (MBOAT superfamily)